MREDLLVCQWDSKLNNKNNQRHLKGNIHFKTINESPYTICQSLDYPDITLYRLYKVLNRFNDFLCTS